jgi:L-iditol 2-dehydrogenase
LILKALVLEEYNRFVYKEVPEPVLGTNDLMVRVIAEVGSEVKTFQPGERVTFDSTVYCGTCFYCRRGDINLCNHRRVLGVSCDEYRQNGAFAELVSVPQHIVYPLPEKVSFAQGAMVEPCSVAYHAVSHSSPTPADTAVVVGAGIIGLLVVQILRAGGCQAIIAVDLEADKLKLARQLGADIGLNPGRGDAISRIKKMTAQRGADVAFDAVGIDASFKTAIGSLRKGGQLTLIGNLSSDIRLPLQTVVTGEVTLNGSCASRGEYPACLDMIAAGMVRVEPFITAVAPLAEGAKWFQRLYRNEKGLLKVILEP